MIKEVRIVALFCCVYLFSCNNNSPATNYLPNSSGSGGEVIVILNEEDIENVTGNIILEDLSRPIEHFLSYEPEFDADLFAPSKFSKMVRKFRNLIIIDIKDTDANQTPSTVYRKNVWANNQLVIYVHAKDTTALIKEYRSQANKIHEAINRQDQLRYSKILSGINDPVTQEKISNKFGFNVDLPVDFFFASEGENHLWFKKEKMEYRSGTAYQVVENIVMRVAPFDNDSAFKPNYIIESANTNTGKIILSSNDNGLVIENQFDPVFKEINFNGNYGMQMNALWKFESPLMGGPYASLTVHDPNKNRVITIEGFIFAPKFDKREYMKEIEAILYSLDF